LIALEKDIVLVPIRQMQSRMPNIRFQASSNMCRVLGIAVGLSLVTAFEVVELLLGLRLGFAGSVGVIDRTETKDIMLVHAHMRHNAIEDCQNIRLEAGGNVCRVLVLLLGDLGLVVEVLVAQSLELFARVLFAFGGGVVVAESTGEGWC
jgi:hypothetical protein